MIRDATDDEGLEIPTQDIETGKTLDLFAAGYNEFEIYIGDQLVDWTLTGTLGTLAVPSTLDPTTGASTTAFTAGTVSEEGTIEATTPGAIIGETGTITVVVSGG
ncbi:hypothetical protein ES708_28704 [subsurface metagenome]